MRLGATDQVRPGRDVEHLYVGLRFGVGVIVDVYLAPVGLLVFVVKLLDGVLPALVEVDGALVDYERRAVEVYLADDARPVTHVYYHDVFGRCAPQAYLFGGIDVGGPIPPPPDVAEYAVLFQVFE